MPRQPIRMHPSNLGQSWSFLFWALFTASVAQAGELSLSPTPLLQTVKVPPNIVLVLNDSYHSQGQTFHTSAHWGRATKREDSVTGTISICSMWMIVTITTTMSIWMSYPQPLQYAT